MKIAIQGHPFRGKEVIQILESLGGVNGCSLKGELASLYYYINYDCDNKIQCYDIKYVNKYCEKYTLEEFKKEFPFKIGDKVSIVGVGHSIIALEYFSNKLCYKLDNRLHYSSKTIKLYNEMKEERNITLTLDKAKEWYKKGGELREIALQAFNEKELTKVVLPKTWEEFCINYPVKKGECCIGFDSINFSSCNHNTRPSKNWIPSQKSAEAHLAMMQLEQLRDCWRQGNIPQGDKYKIRKVGSKYKVVYGVEDAFLSFCDQQTAEEFLECFRDLIEKAGDLI
jgi:hypothetical protein